MSKRTILMASPREPSGSSWLINCLLELGVRVNMKSAIDRAWRSGNVDPSAMWQATGEGRWRLHSRAEELRKWMPVLARQETLVFRDDVEVLYVQELPRPEFAGERTVLFLRDPRDAIQSLYRRVKPEMTLQEYVRFPQPDTLLDAIDYWSVFIESWLARDGCLWYTFEDYKTDDVALLSRIAGELGIEATPGEIAQAAHESSYEKARVAEEQYRATHPGDEEVAMRAGRVGEWMTSQELRDLSTEIEGRLGLLLRRLGYVSEDPKDVAAGSSDLREVRSGEPSPAPVSQMHFLSIFQHIDLPRDMRAAAENADPMACPQLPQTLRLASTIDAEAIRRARLLPREARTLLDSLDEYAKAWQVRQSQRLQAARAVFEDGTQYHMSRIRELMASRRRPKSDTQQQ